MGLALKHFFKLFKDVLSYSWVNEVWWPVPLLLMLLGIGILAATTQIATPYIYAIF